jgi:hypothetical protein
MKERFVHRRETFEAPEAPERPRRRRRITAATIVGAVVLSGIGVGAATASATPNWAHPSRHHSHPHHRHAWALPSIHRDAYSSGWRTPRTVRTPQALAAAPASGATSSAAPTVGTPTTSTPTTAAPTTGTTAPATTTGATGTYGTANALFAASSPWNTPVPASAAVDPSSAAISSKVLNNRSLVVNLDLISFGQPFFTATASTPKVTLGGAGGGIGPVPMDPSWVPNNGSDAKMNIIDPTTHTIYELQGYRKAGNVVQWAVKHDYTTALGDGYPANGERRGPTGSGMSQAAGTIRASDLASGSINHALSFMTSTPVLGFRYPASQTDGSTAGVGIQEGMRVQLDPSVDVDSISGLTSGEKMIMKALQKYGAFCSDNGGGNNQAMGFYIEKPNSSNQATYDAAGLTKDWQLLNKIPRDKLRVLAASVTPKP